MKKLLLLLFALGFAIFSHAQEDGFETISFGADLDRKSTRLNSSHTDSSRMPSSA